MAQGAIPPILRAKVAASRLDGVTLVALQHLLPSLVSLFKRNIALGIQPSRIFVLGKPYSTVPKVAEELASLGITVHVPPDRHFEVGEYEPLFQELVAQFWSAVVRQLTDVRRLIVLDEGGWLSAALPEDLPNRVPLVGIEHTMQGLMNVRGTWKYPVILMAASAAKTRFESPVIAEAILARLLEVIPSLMTMSVGIIGLGNLGRAVATTLQDHGVEQLWGHDIDAAKADGLRFVRRGRSVGDVVKECQVILGCTGRDVLEPGASLQGGHTRRWIASCSSADIEFRRLAILLARRSHVLRVDPFADVRGHIGKREVILLNGGFPVNFDRRTEHEPGARIQLTRELTFASILQAAVGSCPSNGPAMLDPEIQRTIVEKWLRNPATRSLFPHWVDHPVEWWQTHSSGQYSPQSLTGLVSV